MPSILLEFIVAFCQKLICELNNIFSSAFITIMFVGDDGDDWRRTNEGNFVLC
jgi:hypothetical protein